MSRTERYLWRVASVPLIVLLWTGATVIDAIEGFCEWLIYRPWVRRFDDKFDEAWEKQASSPSQEPRR